MFSMKTFRFSTWVVCLIAVFFGGGVLSARTFTDVTGKKIEAEFVKADAANVVIRVGGKEFSLPITRFSAADQQFIRDAAKAPAASAAPAEDVKPGATLTLDFPDLTPDRKDQPAQCQVNIPSGYDPSKKFPLVIWLAGGEGNNTPNRSFLPAGDFIAAGLPYPKGANNPGQANMVGAFEKIWTYHKRMIDEIYKRVPNIDRASSIVAGFSNGGHAIDGMLRMKKKEGDLADYFGVFILVDGGGTEASSYGSLPSLKGKFAYLCWGETSPAKPNVSALAREFKTKGASHVASEMAATGHAFAESEQPKIKDWLAKSVLPVLAKDAGTATAGK
jgi:hypothetical protein